MTKKEFIEKCQSLAEEFMNTCIAYNNSIADGTGKVYGSNKIDADGAIVGSSINFSMQNNTTTDDKVEPATLDFYIGSYKAQLLQGNAFYINENLKWNIEEYKNASV